MELQTLRWFVSVADGRTVTETAERFQTTQPAVTRGLRRLAEQFDAPLTERDGRRLRLTFAGEIAARAARSALGEIDEAARAVAEANDPARGTIRVGFLNPLGTWLVPRLLVEFHATHADVRFDASVRTARLGFWTHSSTAPSTCCSVRCPLTPGLTGRRCSPSACGWPWRRATDWPGAAGFALRSLRPMRGSCSHPVTGCASASSRSRPPPVSSRTSRLRVTTSARCSPWSALGAAWGCSRRRSHRRRGCGCWSCVRRSRAPWGWSRSPASPAAICGGVRRHGARARGRHRPGAVGRRLTCQGIRQAPAGCARRASLSSGCASPSSDGPAASSRSRTGPP